jgi:hypothetical protein
MKKYGWLLLAMRQDEPVYFTDPVDYTSSTLCVHSVNGLRIYKCCQQIFYSSSSTKNNPQMVVGYRIIKSLFNSEIMSATGS